jgi:hypothetical protein
LPQDFIDGLLDLLAVGHIAGEAQDVAPVLLKVGLGAVEFVRVAGAEGHASPLADEFAGEDKSESARAAHDQNILAAETVTRGSAQ